jgi:hypothetical protein
MRDHGAMMWRVTRALVCTANDMMDDKMFLLGHCTSLSVFGPDQLFACSGGLKSGTQASSMLWSYFCSLAFLTFLPPALFAETRHANLPENHF